MKRKIQTIESESRAAAEIRTDPFVFTWTVNVAGVEESGGTEPWYDWLESESGDGRRRLYPRCTNATRIKRYTPAPGLFREFASISGTPESIQDFAGRRGDLFGGGSFEDVAPIMRGGRLVGGTSFERWVIKLRDLQKLVGLWDRVLDKRRHSELAQYIKRTPSELSYGSHTIARGDDLRHFGSKDLVRPALAALQWEINRRLADTETPTLVVPQLAWTPDYRQRLIFRPSNLLGEMWVRFAQAVAGEFRLVKCSAPDCSEYLQLGPGGRRADVTTCSARCRQRASRRGRKAASKKGASKKVRLPGPSLKP